MQQAQEVMFGNAVIWAHRPIRKKRAGMRILGGKVAEIVEQGKAAPDAVSSVDLEGMHIIPGLIDAHRHFFVTALLGHHGDASGWKSKEDALAAIETACASRRSHGGWVFFSGLDYGTWKKLSLPTLREIDAVSGGAAVFVSDITLHRGFVSSEAIRRTGLRKENLRHGRDMTTRHNGESTGLIWEEAHGRVLFTMFRDILKAYGNDRTRDIILDEAQRCLAMGLTHVHDPGVPADVQRLLQEISHRTPLKISWSIATHDSLYSPPGMEDESQALPSRHAPRSVKFFLDGAHRTAASMPLAAGVKAMLRAVVDALTGAGLTPLQTLLGQDITIRSGQIELPYLRFQNADDLIRRASAFTDRGYRLVMHALGNVAAGQASEVIRALNPQGGASVEHMLVMSDRDLDVFARCGAVASIQPGFIPHYADAIEQQGALPYLKAFPLRSLINRGVPVCISSDGPCGPDDPLYNMRRAVDRMKFDGSALDPEESIRDVEAVAAATFGGSDSLGIENKGLHPGAPATFCIVDGDPFSESSRVMQTWIDGVRVYG